MGKAFIALVVGLVVGGLVGGSLYESAWRKDCQQLGWHRSDKHGAFECRPTAQPEKSSWRVA